MVELDFQYPWWIALLALVPIVAFALWMARGQAGMSPALRTTLVVLRVAVLMLIVLLLLEPTLRTQTRTTVRGRVPVLIDVSQSMQIGDTRKDTVDLVEAAAAMGKLPWPERAADGQLDPQAYASYFSTKEKREEVSMAPRATLVRSVVDHPSLNVFDQLNRGHAVRFHMFARQTEAVQPGENLPDVLAEGLPRADQATRIGDAIDHVLRQYAGSPISAMVLLSDGASNAGAAPEQAAQRLGELDIPLYTVGVGLSEPNDVRLENVIVREVLFTKDLVTIKARIVSSGYEKRTVTLRATLDGVDVASKTIVLAGGAQFEQLSFQAPQLPGRVPLEVEVSPLSGEATIENNTVDRTVRVIDDKLKVLYIEGSPRWEYRYLRSILKRDRRLDVTFVMTEGDAALAKASPDHIDRFPEDPRDAFAHDLLIIGDVRAGTFNPDQMDLIEQLVRERGGALLMLAGEDHAPADYIDTPIARLLPVRLEEGPGEQISRHVHPVLTPAGRDSMVMVVDTSMSRNDARWSIVKPLGTIPRLAGPKPGAEVWAELSDPAFGLGAYPLVAWQRYGAGKVMFVGTDRLWRLRYKVGDEHHTRFWVQAVQFMGLSRLLGENRQVRIETDRAVYEAGEAVHITVDAMNASYEPLEAPGYRVSVTRLDDQFRTTPTLKPVPGIAGLYHTIYVPRQPGRYTVTAGEASAQPQGQPDANVAEFDVRPADAEQMDTAMHEHTLVSMARATGGEYLRLIDLPRLPEMIESRDQTLTYTQEYPLWNTWVVLVLFLLLAGSEWFLRRQNGLA